MTDCVLIQDGKAHQVWSGIAKSDLCYRSHDGGIDPQPVFPQATIDAIVEVADEGSVKEGATYTDGVFTNPPTPRRLVPKSLIVDRLNAAGKLAAAKAALDGDLYARERWYAPDKPAVHSDDPDTIKLLQSIGADPAIILAP